MRRIEDDMLKKFAKLGSLIADKVDSSTRRIRANAEHQINARRGHSAVRDVITEAAEFPKLFTKFIGDLSVAVDVTLGFVGKYMALGAEGEMLAKKNAAKLQQCTRVGEGLFYELVQGFHEIVAIEEKYRAGAAQRAEELEERLEEEVESEEKGLEAGASEADAMQREAAVAQELAVVKRALDRWALGWVQIMEAMGAPLAELKALIEELPMSHPKGSVPFEELWDEPRAALGVAPQAPLSVPGASPHEELASLPRPVDGE